MEFSMTILRFAFTVFLVAAVYIYLLNRLAIFAQPIRLKLAAEGRKLLDRQNLSERDRRLVKFYLNHAFSPWQAVFASLGFPIAVIATLVSVARQRSLQNESSNVRDGNGRIAAFFTISVIAANPLFGIVLLAEYVAFTIFLIVTLGQVGILRTVVTTLADLEGKITFNKLGRLH